MRGCEVGAVTAYRLADAKTGITLLLIPTYAYGSEHHALCAAGRQARRHAAGGTWVLVTGAGKSLLYVGEQCFVACEQCGKWMLPRRRGNVCVECRTPEPAAKEAVTSRSTRRRPAHKRRKRVAEGQLTLPDLEGIEPRA
jgi:hypothetical protein